MRSAEDNLEAGNYETALANLEQAIERDSSDVRAYRLKAETLRRMADSTLPPGEYADLYRRAHAAEEQVIRYGEDRGEEIRTTRQTIYERERERGEKAYNRANKNDEPDGYRRAAAFFGAATAVQPDSAGPALNEAYARLRMGQREDAIPAFERYVERTDTVERKAYKMLGQLYLSHGQYETAVDFLEPATDVYPEDEEIQALRLNAFNQSGEMGRALDAYRDQIEREPESAMQRYNYGALLLQAERYGEAIDQLEAAVDLQGDHVGSQYNLGAAYVNAALARDDSIAALEKQMRRQRSEGELDATTAFNMDEQIDALAERRQALFERAIPPLERVREMQGVKDAVRQDACRALLVAYLQTDRPGKAAQVEECTNFNEFGE